MSFIISLVCDTDENKRVQVLVGDGAVKPFVDPKSSIAAANVGNLMSIQRDLS